MIPMINQYWKPCFPRILSLYGSFVFYEYIRNVDRGYHGDRDNEGL